MAQDKKISFENIRYVKLVVIGSINPNAPFSEQSQKDQVDLLNRCLNDYPKGIIIGKDIQIGIYKIGQHELTMEKSTYHIGFERKPSWEK